MHSPGIESSTSGVGELKEQNPNAFRRDVQYEVMRILKYFTPEFDKIKDENKRNLAANEIFAKWIKDKNAEKFAVSYKTITEISPELIYSDLKKVAELVAINMETLTTVAPTKE